MEGAAAGGGGGGGATEKTSNNGSLLRYYSVYVSSPTPQDIFLVEGVGEAGGRYGWARALSK
jgi:hypothetical protein